jgi:4-amino-4-deoxy-L-arabinose transferase-like glycosyltransferase
MKKPANYKKLFSPIYLLFALITVCVLLSIAPNIQKVPLADSGVFLYISSHMLKGEIPYRDMWDHKPPGIYIVDALGLAMSNHSRWGVWILEYISLFITSLIAYIIIKKIFDQKSAIIVTLLFLISIPFVLEGGNFPEEFALPLQFASIAIFFYTGKLSDTWRWNILGILTAGCVLLKPTNLGSSITILIVTSIVHIQQRRIRALIVHYSFLLLSLMSILICLLLYLTFHNALPSFIDQVGIYNYFYSTSSISYRLQVLSTGMLQLLPSGISLFAVSRWGILVLQLFKQKVRISSTHFFLLIHLPVELVLLGSAAKIYTYNNVTIIPSHYFLPLLPAMTLLTASCFHAIIPRLKKLQKHHTLLKYSILSSIILIGCIFVLSSVFVQLQSIAILTKYSAKQKEIFQCITTQSEKNESILVWGHLASLYLETNKHAPTRFIYLLPVFTAQYNKQQMLDTLKEEIRQKKPFLIIDVAKSTSHVIPSIHQLALRNEYVSLYKTIGNLYTKVILPNCPITIQVYQRGINKN